MLDKIRQNEINSLSQAAEAGALAFTESTCVQISTLALVIAKRIGRSQSDATIRLGEEGFLSLVHEIKIWISQLPSSCVTKIHKANVWPHRCDSSTDEEAQQTLSLHVPGTPTGTESLTWAIYQVLCELGEILANAGFNTNDIGMLYDQQHLPHLGILLRFPWSNEMRLIFTSYGETVAAIHRLSEEMAQQNVQNVQELRDRATSMWDAI